MTVVPTEAQANVAMTKICEMFGGNVTGDMVMLWEDEDGRARCILDWQTGPFEWAHISPQQGGRVEGLDIPPAQDWPVDLWTEPRNAMSLSIWVEDRSE